MPRRRPVGDNGGVRELGRLVGRAIMVARRAINRPEWPPVTGALLGLLATVEVLRWEMPATRLSAALLLGLGATVPLAVARTAIVWSAVTITTATALTLLLLARLTVAGLIAQLVTLYLVGLRRPRLAVPLLVPFIGYAAVQWVLAPMRASLYATLFAGLIAAATGLGSVVRMRREAAERHVFRQTVADNLLEYAARGERARIARELHDVVAHHISMISVQAETARLTTPGMPAEGAERLLAIGDTARAALTEMRRLLGVLREDAGTATTRTPQPGLEQLTELIDEARESSGASTRLIVRGRIAPLDPGVELAAYRIVQEALTNARRHAPGVAVDVELDYGDEALRVRIRDNGPGPVERGAGSRRGGHGLLGMRERAAMVAGDLWTGPAPGTGFLVEALLPVARPDTT
jgi:signal transduction histidine kinase